MIRSLALLLLTLPLAVSAAPRTCLVVGVSDGDTLKARCGQPGSYEEVKVRLNGIDAPEKKQRSDRYGQSVCKVMVTPASAPRGPKTLDAALAMVTAGMAWWYRGYSREQTAQERGQYEFAETEAKARRAGLWRDADAMAPWDWRKTRREG